MNHLTPIQQALLPQAKPDGIQFTFKGDIDTQSVAVAGTFNSWVGDANPLTRISDTHWQTTLTILPGRHLYKYVVNDQHWILDPANPWVSEDAQNNSCFTLDDLGQVFIRLGDTTAETPNDLYQRHLALPSPDWVRDGVIYQLSISAFAGDFAGVEKRLPYLSDLGVTLLWLMPIHPIGVRGRLGSLGDPYATFDFAAIHPDLGTLGDLRQLVRAAHDRGMRVIMDIPLNRCSCDNPLTEQHPDWFTRDAQGQVYYAVPNRAYFAGFDFSNPALRAYLIEMMETWVREADIDGFRFDDSDLTPLDFLNEIRASLSLIRSDIGLISQSYDELHHLAACDLTYEGATREMVLKITQHQAEAADFQALWQAATYSFPRGALRMRWLEEKEQGRAYRYYGQAVHHAAASVILTLDGVPHILMGQEFDEPRWETWQSLFDPFALDWDSFDQQTFQHYRALITLRRNHLALRRGTVHFLSSPNGVIRYARRLDDEEILVTVNLTARAIALPSTSGAYTLLYQFSHDGAAQPNQVGSFGWVIQSQDTHNREEIPSESPHPMQPTLQHWF